MLCLGNENMLSSDTTLTILKTIQQSSSLKTLDLLDLSHCDWTEQENCEVLTDTIVSAPSLLCIGIAHQQGP